MYKLITKGSHLLIAIKELEQHALQEPLLALDTETYQSGPETIYTFKDPYTNAVRLVQIKARNSVSYVFDVKQLGSDITPLTEFLNREDITWVSHNSKFDYKMLAINLGVYLKKIYCTYIAGAVMGYATGMSARASCGLGLKDLVRDLLDVELSKEHQSDYWGGTLIKSQIDYAAKDVDYLIPLYDLFTKVFKEEYQCTEAVDLEMEVLPVVSKMELNGVGFDLNMYHKVQACARLEIPKLIKQMCTYFGVKLQTVFNLATKKFESQPAHINFNSRADVLKLFSKSGIELPDLKAETLITYVDKHEIVRVYSNYKTLQKQLSTNYEEYVHPITKRIYANYNQCGTATGRFSSSFPNMQQISKIDIEVPLHLIDPNWKDKYKAKDGKYYLNYRYCFVSKPSDSFLSIDYSSQELAIMAVAASDQFMIDVLNKPQFIKDDQSNRTENPEADLYSQVAAKAFKVEVAKARTTIHPKLGKKCRDLAKVALLGSCIAEGQLVNTARGKIPIEQVVVGDYVAVDEGHDKRVLAVFNNGIRDVIKVTTRDHLLPEHGGQTRELICTQDHKVAVYEYHQGTLRDTEVVWMEAQQCLGRDLLKIDWGESEAVSIEPYGKARVYDLTVEDRHCFFASGLLVHNCYGKTEHSMPDDLGITLEEGKKLLRDIFGTMPQLEKWLEENAKQAEKTRLSRFGLGRLRFLNDSHHLDKGAVGRAGRNTPIQGLAALMMKKALVYLDEALKQVPGAMIIGTVHDEVLVEMPDDLNATEDLLKDEYGYLEPQHRLGAKLIMEAMYAGSRYFLKGVVPDKATCGVGRSWTK